MIILFDLSLFPIFTSIVFGSFGVDTLRFSESFLFDF